MDKHTEHSAKIGFLPLVLSLGGFSLFLVIVVLYWFDRRPDTVAFGGASPEARAEILREHRDREQEMLNDYGWVDQDQGIVRLPIERAMELFVDEMNQGEGQN